MSNDTTPAHGEPYKMRKLKDGRGLATVSENIRGIADGELGADPRPGGADRPGDDSASGAMRAILGAGPR
jgi:hypothetical protein